jgi:hypothetical protein
MTLKNRLKKVEQEAINRALKTHPPRIFIYYEGEEYGNLSGGDVKPQRVRVADFLATARNEDAVIRVVYEDKKPISNISGPGQHEMTAGIDMMKV